MTMNPAAGLVRVLGSPSGLVRQMPWLLSEPCNPASPSPSALVPSGSNALTPVPLLQPLLIDGDVFRFTGGELGLGELGAQGQQAF